VFPDRVATEDRVYGLAVVACDAAPPPARQLDLDRVTVSGSRLRTDAIGADHFVVVTEVTAERGSAPIGRDVLTFQRVDGVAENFHTEQNRDLLVRLASQTGGRYWRPEELSRLPDEISYSEAGVSARVTKELWNMPAFFLLILLLRSAEWFVRRSWGIV